MLKSALILAAFGMVLQVGDKEEKKPQVVPITEEHHHHLVLDNEYVRVFHVEVAPHAETRYHQHDMDYVFVTLGDSQVESVRVGEKPVKLELKDGDTRFTKGGFAHKAVNLSDKPFVNVTVELKKPPGEASTENRWLDTTCNGNCVQTLLTMNSIRCLEYTTGNWQHFGIGPFTPANRLVIMMTEGKNIETGKLLRSGDIFWSSGPTEIRTIHEPDIEHERGAPLSAVFCEFAKAGQDFLKVSK